MIDFDVIEGSERTRSEERFACGTKALWVRLAYTKEAKETRTTHNRPAVEYISTWFLFRVVGDL